MKTLFAVSGGDAPGINMVLAHYTALAEASGDTVMGAVGGLPGLVNGNLVSLSAAALVPWMGQPGSFLPSSRDPVLKKPEARSALLDVLKANEVDNVVLFGGNGTLRHVLPLLTGWGIPVIGLPSTIDNDVPGTERTLGFDSACNYAYATIDGIMSTAHALSGRFFLVETLGGSSGYLALQIAAGACADIVLIPEYPYDLGWLCDRVVRNLDRKGFGLLVLCEGVSTSRTLVDDVTARTGHRIRDARLGNAQRAGKPSYIDRALGAQMAQAAYHALRTNAAPGVVVVRNGQVVLHAGTLDGEPLAPPDRALYNTINRLA